MLLLPQDLLPKPRVLVVGDPAKVRAKVNDPRPARGKDAARAKAAPREKGDVLPPPERGGVEGGSLRVDPRLHLVRPHRTVLACAVDRWDTGPEIVPRRAISVSEQMLCKYLRFPRSPSQWISL